MHRQNTTVDSYGMFNAIKQINFIMIIHNYWQSKKAILSQVIISQNFMNNIRARKEVFDSRRTKVPLETCIADHIIWIVRKARISILTPMSL